MKEFFSSNFKSTEAISKAKSQQQRRTKMNSEVLCNNSSTSGLIIHNSFSKLEIWYPHSPGCSYLGCDWDDHQEDTIAHLPFEQDLAFRTCLPHPCLWNVCPTCLPHVRSYPRTQPRDTNVVLKSSGLETCMKLLQTSINTLRSGRNWLICGHPKKPLQQFLCHLPIWSDLPFSSASPYPPLSMRDSFRLHWANSQRGCDPTNVDCRSKAVCIKPASAEQFSLCNFWKSACYIWVSYLSRDRHHTEKDTKELLNRN